MLKDVVVVTASSGKNVSSQEDIAHDLNISASLVSKVLNNRLGTTRVTPQTMAAIRRRAVEIQYRKHGSAVALATGRQGAVGVFIHRIGLAGSGLTEALLEGIAEGSMATGERLVLQFFETSAQFRAWSPEVQPTLVDGIIVAGKLHRELRDDFLQIQARGVRVVTVLRESMHPTLLNIGVDEREVGRAATAHLIERGCQQIAHIKVLDEHVAGYWAALDTAGIRRQTRLVFDPPGPDHEYDFEAKMGQLAVAHFAARGIPFDGLVAQSDHQAIGAVNALLALGRRVPQDVKVIGVDDSPICSLSVVPLSSVSLEFRKRGLAALQMLTRPANDRPDTMPQFQPVVHARASSAPTAQA